MPFCYPTPPDCFEALYADMDPAPGGYSSYSSPNKEEDMYYLDCPDPNLPSVSSSATPLSIPTSTTQYEYPAADSMQNLQLPSIRSEPPHSPPELEDDYRAVSRRGSEIELNAEDKLLLQLKDEENLPWKRIAARFQTEFEKPYRVPALQMRLKRLRDRLQAERSQNHDWTEVDSRALRLAHEYWTQCRFDIIATKMTEFGAPRRWSARQLEQKWNEMGLEQDSVAGYSAAYSPALQQYPPPSQYSSASSPHFPLTSAPQYPSHPNPSHELAMAEMCPPSTLPLNNPMHYPPSTYA